MHYEIRVKGELSDGWSRWFHGMRVRSETEAHTTIDGPLADQAALHGLLDRIGELGLELIEIRRIGADASRSDQRPAGDGRA